MKSQPETTTNDLPSYKEVKQDLEQRISKSLDIIIHVTNNFTSFIHDIRNTLTKWKDYYLELYLIILNRIEVDPKKKNTLNQIPPKPDITLYEQQLYYKSKPNHALKPMNEITQQVNNELNNIWKTHKALLQFKYIIKTQTLFKEIDDFISNISKQNMSSNDICLGVLQAIGLNPEEYLLPKEIFTLVEYQMSESQPTHLENDQNNEQTTFVKFLQKPSESFKSTGFSTKESQNKKLIEKNQQTEKNSTVSSSNIKENLIESTPKDTLKPIQSTIREFNISLALEENNPKNSSLTKETSKPIKFETQSVSKFSTYSTSNSTLWNNNSKPVLPPRINRIPLKTKANLPQNSSNPNSEDEEDNPTPIPPRINARTLKSKLDLRQKHSNPNSENKKRTASTMILFKPNPTNIIASMDSDLDSKKRKDNPSIKPKAQETINIDPQPDLEKIRKMRPSS